MFLHVEAFRTNVREIGSNETKSSMWFESVIFHSCHQICGFSNTVSVGTGLIIYIIHAVFIVFRVWTSCFYRFNLYIFHAYKGVLKKDQPKRVVFSYLIESVRTPAYEDDREIHETTVLQRQVYFGSFWVWEKSCFKKSNFSCMLKKKMQDCFLLLKINPSSLAKHDVS